MGVELSQRVAEDSRLTRVATVTRNDGRVRFRRVG